MVKLTEAAHNIQEFEGQSLTATLMALESRLQGIDRARTSSLFQTLGIDPTLFDSALVLKQAAGQINVVVHAVGILLALPFILTDDEKVQYLSLGAGNTGRLFDLETNLRVAEFKFTQWRGGSEAIRQNQLFKDFYLLAEHDTNKARYLYVVGAEYPLKFLNNQRALSSVLSRNNKLWLNFHQRHGTRFSTVNEYYSYRQHLVQLVDLAQIVPYFAQTKVQLSTADQATDQENEA